MVISSSRTIFTTCSVGDSEVMTSCPSAFSRTCSIRSLTTERLTSASSSATRISRNASPMFSSVTVPCPRRFLNARCSLSDKFSNIDDHFSGTRWARAGLRPDCHQLQQLEKILEHCSVCLRALYGEASALRCVEVTEEVRASPDAVPHSREGPLPLCLSPDSSRNVIKKHPAPGRNLHQQIELRHIARQHGKPSLRRREVNQSVIQRLPPLRLAILLDPRQQSRNHPSIAPDFAVGIHDAVARTPFCRSGSLVDCAPCVGMAGVQKAGNRRQLALGHSGVPQTRSPQPQLNVLRKPALQFVDVDGRVQQKARQELSNGDRVHEKGEFGALAIVKAHPAIRRFQPSQAAPEFGARTPRTQGQAPD